MYQDSTTTKPPLLIGQLCERLGYQRRQPLEKVWNLAFQGEAMPKDHEAIQPEKVVLFLRFFLTQNAQGRSASFYDRANELLSEYIGTKEVVQTQNDFVPQPEKEVIELAAQQEERGVTSFREVVNRIRDFSILALYFIVVVGHGILVWYDCAQIWGMPGTIAGGIGFAIILAAFLMATDKTRERTSESALTFVAFVDVASIFVHYPVFSGYDVANWITTVCICVFIPCMSWGALYLFRDFKLD
jgi:hypothetical protein